MKRWRNLTELEKRKYGPALMKKESDPEDYNEYYLVVTDDNKIYWIYYPEVDWE